MKNNLPKVLIGAPTSENKDYIFTDFYTRLRCFSYPNVDYFFPDNSINPNYHKKIIKYGFQSCWVNPKGRDLRYVMADCNELIRKKAIDENFDYIVSLETDQFPPLNFIEYLMSFNLPVVSLPYFIGVGTNSIVLYRSLKPEPIDPKNKHKKRKASDYQLSFKECFTFFNGSLTQSFLNGIGCTLIHKDIFTKIPFRVDASFNNTNCADTFFYHDLYKQKISVYVCTRYLSYHYNKSWSEIFDTHINPNSNS